ncbi:MAG TPA: SigE family RNA polymerase sigma factor [Solirubrobacteraceae bacterium]|jgi:RNA polymerase sigma-70 factor (sigma-E family)|nr:SigE family RNA polymerase sigma factor [Solirubrobacteraceae bacterium]
MSEFKQFVVQHVDSLLRTAYLITWDEREAEDLVQECLFKVARRWPRVSSMDQPAAYARRILVNLAIDAGPHRARRRRELEPVLGAAEPSSDPLGLLHDRADLMEALAGLPREQRAVLVLRYFNDLTEAQAATTLGCSEGTVKSRASRGLTRLREALSPLPIESGGPQP